MAKKKISKGVKIGIIIASVIVGLFFGYIAYAYIVSDVISECNNLNDYCDGIWPFESESSCDSFDCPDEKPIIYLYPEVETEISVELGYPEKLSVSYPKYRDGWKVLAQPNGDLIDLETGRGLYSLYWEGKHANFKITDEGFVVKGAEAAEFLEEKLAILGLNEREAEEFIIYWLPRMQANEFNYVRFATEAEIAEYMPLEVVPKPDTVIRILMILAEAEAGASVKEQVLVPAPAREGFTVVEWGGNAPEKH